MLPIALAPSERDGGVVFLPMRILPNDEQRLELLSNSQPGRPWRSVFEKRRCIVCEHTFRGRDAVVRWARHCVTKLGCPKCDSAPALWVRIGNPLTDDSVWAEWERALALVAGDDDGAQPSPGFAR